VIYRKIENNKVQSIKQCLQYYCGDISKMQISRAILDKDVKVNGKRIKTNITVYENDIIEAYFNETKQNVFDIVYQDENILVINKKKGIETVSFDENKQTLQTLVQKDFANARAVHRIDTNTLGLIAFALNDTAEKELLDAFKTSNVVKKYYAVVSSHNIKDNETFVDYFIKPNNSIVKFGASENDGKQASLSYQLIKQVGDLAQIEVDLHTGKTHQIRAQLAYHKIFILGDGKYGDKNLNRKYKKDVQALISVYLRFENLVNLKYLQSLPFDIRKITNLL
jgi:23S rRNA pseudouridine955/2504/2580 synthase